MIYHIVQVWNTVKPVYSGHLRFLKKVSSINSVCYIEFWNFWAKKTTEIKMKDVSLYDKSKRYK